jgi:hypothetical protein
VCTPAFIIVRKIIAIVGAFLLIADYIVTASISALSGFQYAGVPHPEIFAGVAILGIGALNFFGPKRTGELAIAEPRFELPEGTTYGSPMLCAVRGIGGTLEFAIGIAKDMNRPLYITFVREQAILTLEDRKRHWTDDPQARKIFAYAKEKADGHPILPRYTVSDVPAHTIVDLAVTVGASRLILGAPRKNMLVKLIRGNMILQVSRFLPEKIHLLVYA